MVRFYHRKHQCYIVGEGSFVGRYGYLPDTSDSNDDSMAASLEISTLNRRRSSAVPSTTASLSQFEVKADIEAITEEPVSASMAVPSPFAFDLESQEQSISFSTDGSSSLSDAKSRVHTLSKQMRKRSRPLNSWESSVDEVVSEDGKKEDTLLIHAENASFFAIWPSWDHNYREMSFTWRLKCINCCLS